MTTDHRRLNWRSQAPDATDPTTVTPRQLAQELGHHDHGCAVSRFLRNPDDGLEPFADHPWWRRWQLTPKQADRVRDRFS